MRILVIRFSSLGDVVLASAPLQALARQYPAAELMFATKREFAPLFDGFDVPLGLATLAVDDSIGTLARGLDGQSFDLVVDLHGSLRSRLLCQRVKARTVRRVNKNTWRRLMMVWSKRGLDHPISVVSSYLGAARCNGAADSVFPRLFLTPREIERVDTFRHATGNRSIGIGWGAKHPTKAVPRELWSSLLEKTNPGKSPSVIVFGLEEDRSAISEFVTTNNGDKGRTDLAIGLPLREVMVRLAACDLFVSSDSGLMHLAAALEVPTIGLFGPTHPSLGFAPQGPNSHSFHAGTWCSPCHRHGSAPCFRDRRHCFDELDTTAISQVVKAYLG